MRCLRQLVTIWASSFLLVFAVPCFAETQPYRVNQGESYIHIYTGVGGALKTMSHKHLVAITQMEGTVTIDDGEQSTAYLRVRPDQFLVDDDAERARAVDPSYREPVADWIKTGTQKNMLGKKLLAAAIYPEILIEINLTEVLESPIFDVFISIRGQSKALKIPVSMMIEDQRIRVIGDFQLHHADLGLKPFSAMAGLAKVADELRFQFEITADQINF